MQRFHTFKRSISSSHYYHLLSLTITYYHSLLSLIITFLSLIITLLSLIITLLSLTISHYQIIITFLSLICITYYHSFVSLIITHLYHLLSLNIYQFVQNFVAERFRRVWNQRYTNGWIIVLWLVCNIEDGTDNEGDGKTLNERL